MPRSELEEIVQEAEAKGRVLGVRLAPDEDDPSPWKTPPSRRRLDPPLKGPLPDNIEIVLGNEVFVPTQELPPGLRNRLIRLAAFQNPEFYRAQAMRLPTYRKPRIIGCARGYPLHIGLPRGCLDEVLRLLSDLKIGATIRDERHPGQPLEVDFVGQLRPEQKLASNALLASWPGTWESTSTKLSTRFSGPWNTGGILRVTELSPALISVRDVASVNGLRKASPLLRRGN